jgi:5-methylcytosine-specific restriction endonuclease McrA
LKAHAWYQLVPTVSAEAQSAGHLFLGGTAPEKGFFDKGGLPLATQPSYKYKSAPYTSLGDLATVSFFEQMAGGTYTDIKKHQIKVKMLNVALMEEWAIINGNSALGNALQYDGLDVQITLNVQQNSGNALALSDITAVEQKIVAKGGKPQLVVLSYRDLMKFNELVLGSYYRLFQAGAGSMADIPAGISVTRWLSPFGVVDIVGSRYIVPVGQEEQDFALVLDDKTVLEDGKYALPSINFLNSVKLLLTKDNTERSPKFRERVETKQEGLCIVVKQKNYRAWNKGLTKETSPKLASMAVTQSKVRLGRTDLNVWNKGLTKSDDCRIAKQGQLVSQRLQGYKRNDEFKAKLSAAFSGEKHPNWKGGRNDYRGSNWKECRQQALERDNYTCQFCKTTVNLIIHHIIAYAINKSNSLDNLITLCRSCHYKLEWLITKIEKHNQDIVRSARKLVELGRNDLTALFEKCNN